MSQSSHKSSENNLNEVVQSVLNCIADADAKIQYGITRQKRKDVLASWQESQQSLKDAKQKLEGLADLSVERTGGKPVSQDLVRLASFPEQNANPIFEISLDGRIEYANPSIRKLFPTLEQQQTSHPYLAGWDEIVEKFRKDPHLNVIREFELEGHFYQQSIFFIKEYRSLRVYGRDITPRKKREAEREQLFAQLEEQRQIAEILASEAQQRADELDATFTALAEAVIVYAANGKAQRANPAAINMLGFDPVRIDITGLVGKLSTRYPDGRPVEPADTPSVRALAGETVTSERYILSNAKGRDLTVTVSSSPLWKNGKVTGAVAVWRDVTEREQLLNDVQRWAAELDAIITSIADGVMIEDMQSNIIRLNPAAEQILGYSLEEQAKPLVERVSTVLQVSSAEGQPVTDSRDLPGSRALRGETVHNVLFEIKHARTGKKAWALFSAAPLRTTDGVIFGMVATMTDITGRMRVEEALKESEAKYRNLFNTMEEGFCIIEMIFDPQGKPLDYRFLEVNPAFEKQTGLHEAEGKLMRELAPAHEAHWFEIYGKIALTGEPAHFVNEAKALNRWYDVYAYRLGRPEDRQVAIIFNDISAHMRDEEALRQAEKALQEANLSLELRVQERTGELQSAYDELAMAEEELKFQNEELEKGLVIEKTLRGQLIQAEKFAALARLVGSIAHEINNPLQTVQNCLYLLQQDNPPSESQEVLEMAVSESRRIGSLVLQLRETYRPTKYLKPVDYNLIEVLNKVNTLLRPQFRQNNVQCQLHHDTDSLILHGIPDQIQQVCLNICLNAVDAIGPNGGQLDIAVSLSQDQKKVSVSFHDTGPGIPEENLTRIFEPFFSTKEKGSGLGLAICYEIVKEHAGEITALSEPGEGATFIVRLPVG